MVARKHTDERATKKRPSSTRITTGSKNNRKEPPQEQNEFLDLMIDTAFKFVFSKKQFMIPLLNSILQREDPIADITYLPTEQVAEYKQGRKKHERNAIYRQGPSFQGAGQDCKGTLHVCPGA